ncbi:MAG: hypothetical protein AAB420_00295 [Patescibacteria group bacterium]
MSIPPDDAVTIAPDIHKLVYDDEELRILDVHVKPGEKAGMHRHPRNITYILKGGMLRFTDETWKTKDVTFADGHTAHMPETLHAVENTGQSEIHAIQIEFKK